MSAAFYKTSDPAVLAAMAAYEREVGSVFAAGKEFSAHYGGKLLTRADLHGRSVAGLCFEPAKDDPLWTKPDAQQAGMQRPRTSLKGATKEQRAALAELAAGWRVRFPSAKADLEPVLATMGTDWGSLFFTNFAMFQHEGAVYASTGAKLAPCMVEILSSEYAAAKAAYELTKATA
jgi:hypothetical protein